MRAKGGEKVVGKNHRAGCGAATLLFLSAALVGLSSSPAVEPRGSSVELLVSARSTRRPLGPAQQYIEAARHTSRAAVNGQGALVGLKEERENVLGTLDSLRSARLGMLKEWPGAAVERAAESRVARPPPSPTMARPQVQPPPAEESARQPVPERRHQQSSSGQSSLERVDHDEENLLGSLGGGMTERNTLGALFAVHGPAASPPSQSKSLDARYLPGHYSSDGLEWIVGDSARRGHFPKNVERSASPGRRDVRAGTDAPDDSDVRQAASLRALEAEVRAAEAEQRRGRHQQARRDALEGGGGGGLSSGALSLKKLLGEFGWGGGAPEGRLHTRGVALHFKSPRRPQHAGNTPGTSSFTYM